LLVAAAVEDVEGGADRAAFGMGGADIVADKDL
jgi:hypothetical protein